MANTDVKKFDRSALIGSWFGKQHDEAGDEVVETAELFSNGEFEISFTRKGDHENRTIERGLWGLSGDVHFTITLIEEVAGKSYQADTEHEDNYQAYKVVRLDRQVFEYQHLLSGEIFRLIRLDDPADNISQH